MKVFVDPIPNSLSQAMHRVARALKRHAPPEVEIVNKPELADFQVVHVVSMDSLKGCKAPAYAIIQYCLMTANAAENIWKDAWDGAGVVFSYYDLSKYMDRPFPQFIRSPLGVDSVFLEERNFFRDIGVVTTGYVAGPRAEAIEEVAIAASLAGLKTMHVGPKPVGMGKPPLGWSHRHGITDIELAELYSRAQWVAGLRHVEGFELPLPEGFMCGARPIAFDREDMRHWWGDSADYVQERSGKPLIEDLVELFRHPASPVLPLEREAAMKLFNWEEITGRFWSAILSQAVNA